MRLSHIRAASASAAAIAGMALGGCDKLTPNGQSDTMTLLKAGSEQVCVRPDVQKALRSLILPKSDEGATSEVRTAITDFTIAFDLTTLQSADKAISRATCNTIAKMAGLGSGERSFQITYQVSPSAEQPGDFVVSGNTDDARAFASAEIGNIVAHRLEDQAHEQEAAQAEQARQKLLATITPAWLVGSWIPAESNASLCGDGHALVFRPGHRFTAFQTTGQWALTANDLHVIAQSPTVPMDLNGTITAADPLSFSSEAKDGSSVIFRRCSREELSSGALPDVIAPMDPAQN